MTKRNKLTQVKLTCFFITMLFLLPALSWGQGCADGTFSGPMVTASANGGTGSAGDPVACDFTIEFCYDLETFDEELLNWAHGIFITNLPSGATASMGATGAQMTADGNMNQWIFIDEAAIAGGFAGPGNIIFQGYYVDAISGGAAAFDGDPTNNFGDQGNSGGAIVTPERFDGSSALGTGINLVPFCFSITFTDCPSMADYTPSLGISGDGESGSHTFPALSCLLTSYSPTGGPNGNGSVSYLMDMPMVDCAISNVAVTGGACSGNNYNFSVSFDVVGGSGAYEVYDATNCVVLGAGTSSPISAIIPNSIYSSPVNIVVRDVNMEVVYENDRTNNVINAYVNGAGMASATSTSDFSNVREIAVGNGLIIAAQDASPGNGEMNRLYVYDASPSAITLNRVHESPVNLWGIHYDVKGDRLFAIRDNSDTLAEFHNYSIRPGGAITVDASITVEGIIRTHGITYDEAYDIMFLTDVGSGAVADDGAFVVIYDYAVASADGVVSADEQVRIEGAATLLGNPVDIAYAKLQNMIYIAERANGGGRVLTFMMPLPSSDGGDIPPVNDDDDFDGVAAVYYSGGTNTVCASSNTQAVIRTYDAAFGFTDRATFAMDGDGIYCDYSCVSECVTVIRPSPACSCSPNLNLTGLNNGSNSGANTQDDNETDGGLSSNQTISATATVDYDSATEISLSPGFSTKAGAVFSAFIDGCNNGGGGENATGNESGINVEDTAKEDKK